MGGEKSESMSTTKQAVDLTILASPPWKKDKESRPEIVVEEIHHVDYAEQIHWTEPPRDSKVLDTEAHQYFEMQLKFHGQLGIKREWQTPEDSLINWNETSAAGRYWPDHQRIDYVLERFGLEALPGCLNWCDTAESVESLGNVDSPMVASMMGRAFVQKKSADLREKARAWMKRFPRAAALGILPEAVGKLGKGRELAEPVIRWMQKNGLESELEQAALDMGVEEALKEVLGRDPMWLFPSSIPKPPRNLNFLELPRPQLTDGRALNDEEMGVLVQMLMFSEPHPVYAGLLEIRQACQPKSLEEFGWALFCDWEDKGCKANTKWALGALGALGFDSTVRELVPRIAKWAKKSSARAQLAISVLGAIGSDLAAMHLYRIATGDKFPALQREAEKQAVQLALSRGLSLEELADECVPTEGADKKELGEILRHQTRRLERAMTSRRRWTASRFQKHIVSHSLTVQVAQGLLWGCFEDHKFAKAFRVSEDGTLASQNDETWTLSEGTMVGLVHPLELDQATIKGWGQVFSDYELVQPFSQLDRDVFHLDDKEAGASKLARVEELEVKSANLLGLRSRGWRNGPNTGSGRYCTMEKPLGQGLQAVLHLQDQMAFANPLASKVQVLGAVVLDNNGCSKQVSTWGELDPILVSELLADLDYLRVT